MRFVYGAAIWAFLFAALSFYWALGGRAGAETLGTAFSDPAIVGDPGFVAFLWITAILKALLGLVPLAQVQHWSSRFPRWLRRFGIWSAGIILTVYGTAHYPARFDSGGQQPDPVIDWLHRCGALASVPVGSRVARWWAAVFGGSPRYTPLSVLILNRLHVYKSKPNSLSETQPRTPIIT